MALTPGQTLSHHRLGRKIGAGGMGEVYLAEDTTLDRKVALKVLPAEVAADPGRLARFEREAKALAALNHPHIVTIHSVEQDRGIHFLTMELVEGDSLDRQLAPGGLSLAKVFEVGIAMADALAAAHEKGIVHRDLKPANVMLTKDGRVKVLDFGLAKLLAGTAGPGEANPSRATTRLEAVTGRGAVMGTVPYMSPEQVQGHPLDARTDIFSLGVVLYEMATGRRPFGGRNPAETVSSILRDAPRPVKEAREDAPRHLARIIDHCLQKEPRDRFQTARDVFNELRALRQEVEAAGPAPAGVPAVAVASASASASSPVAAVAPSRRALWIALAGAAVLAAVVAALWLSRGAPSPATGTNSLAVLPFTNMSPDKDQEYFSDGLSEELINVLVKVPDLKVAGRTSSFSFKGKNEDLRTIGEMLGVAHILEGSVRKAGKRIRITAQLVKAADGFHLWSQTYDRTLDDIFAVQDDIARSVASSLKTTLLGAGAGGQRTGNIEAYNLVLKGHYFWKRWGPGDLQKARDLYKQALALDPDNARAWQLLGLTYGNMMERGELSQEEGVRLSRDATVRALALDDSLAHAHAQLGWYKMSYDWDWAGAEAELKKALALEPQDAGVLNLAATLAAVQGRLREANEINRQIHEIDPLDDLLYLNYAITLREEGRLDEALAAARGVLELEPQRMQAHSVVGAIYLAQGKPDAALQEILQETSEQERLFALPLAYYALGRKAESDAALATFTKKYRGILVYDFAQIHAFRGERDVAFEWLDRAYAKRDRSLCFLKADYYLENLRSDPRWLPFLRKMRLTG